MKLSNIQTELNQKGYFYRSEFMRDYNFDGKFFKYLSGYIMDNIETKKKHVGTDAYIVRRMNSYL